MPLCNSGTKERMTLRMCAECKSWFTPSNDADGAVCQGCGHWGFERWIHYKPEDDLVQVPDAVPASLPSPLSCPCLPPQHQSLQLPNFSCRTCGQDLGPSLDTPCSFCLASNNVRFWTDTVNRASAAYGKAKRDLQDAKRTFRKYELELEVEMEKRRHKDIK